MRGFCVHASETYTASQDGHKTWSFLHQLSTVTADQGTFYWQLFSQFWRDDWNSFVCQYGTCQSKRVTYWQELDKDIIVIIVFLILMVGVFRGWNFLRDVIIKETAFHITLMTAGSLRRQLNTELPIAGFTIHFQLTRIYLLRVKTCRLL